MPISEAHSQDPKTLDRMQLELYNHFEHYGTSVQERSDLLRVLTHEEASLHGIKYASAKGLKSYVDKDKFSEISLEADLWKGILLILLTYFDFWIIQNMYIAIILYTMYVFIVNFVCILYTRVFFLYQFCIHFVQNVMEQTT